MRRTITRRELQNDSAAIMRGLDRGETFIVTRGGVPVGELIPIRRHRFTSRADVTRAFASAAQVERERLLNDLDRHVRQDHEPHC